MTEYVSREDRHQQYDSRLILIIHVRVDIRQYVGRYYVNTAELTPHIISQKY